MFVTDIMKQHIVIVTERRVIMALREMIEELEPEFNFNCCSFDATEGFYWCDSQGRACFTSKVSWLPPNHDFMRDIELCEIVNEALIQKRMEDEKRLEEAKLALEKVIDAHIAKENSVLTQLHFTFDGFTTNCIAKNKKGVVARSKATAVGEDKEHFDQLIGANVALLKLMPKEAWPEFLETLMAIIGIDFQVDFNVNAKLVNADEA